jgi:hypothetical protein
VRSENAALRAELERLRTRYQGAVEPPPRTKKPTPEPEPEQFTLAGPSEREPNRSGPPDEALDSVARVLCRMLEERQPGMKWRYYRGELLVPEGMMFFYAHEALRKMWGESPGNPDPPTPPAYQRLTSAERDTVLRSALGRVDEALNDPRACTRRGTSWLPSRSSSTSIFSLRGSTSPWPRTSRMFAARGVAAPKAKQRPWRGPTMRSARPLPDKGSRRAPAAMGTPTIPMVRLAATRAIPARSLRRPYGGVVVKG